MARSTSNQSRGVSESADELNLTFGANERRAISEIVSESLRRGGAGLVDLTHPPFNDGYSVASIFGKAGVGHERSEGGGVSSSRDASEHLVLTHRALKL